MYLKTLIHKHYSNMKNIYNKITFKTNIKKINNVYLRTQIT